LFLAVLMLASQVFLTGQMEVAMENNHCSVSQFIALACFMCLATIN